MAAEKFDILKEFDDLRSSGIPDEQAMAQLKVMQNILSTIVQNMATKDDIARLEKSLDDKLASVEESFAVKLNASDLVLRADFKSETKGLYLRFNILIGLLTIIATSLVTHVSPNIFNKFFS